MTTTVRDRPRFVCPDCGAQHRSAPTEIQVGITLHRHRVYEWHAKPLCPPCALAELDYWRSDRPGRRSLRR